MSVSSTTMTVSATCVVVVSIAVPESTTCVVVTAPDPVAMAGGRRRKKKMILTKYNVILVHEDEASHECRSKSTHSCRCHSLIRWSRPLPTAASHMIDSASHDECCAHWPVPRQPPRGRTPASRCYPAAPSVSGSFTFWPLMKRRSRLTMVHSMDVAGTALASAELLPAPARSALAHSLSCSPLPQLLMLTPTHTVSTSRITAFTADASYGQPRTIPIPIPAGRPEQLPEAASTGNGWGLCSTKHSTSLDQHQRWDISVSF